MIEPPHLRRQRQRNKNKIEPTSAMIELLTTTWKGWLLRQTMKLAGIAGVWLAATLEQAGASAVDEKQLGAAIGLIAAGGVEVLLSYISKKAK